MFLLGPSVKYRPLIAVACSTWCLVFDERLAHRREAMTMGWSFEDFVALHGMASGLNLKEILVILNSKAWASCPPQPALISREARHRADDDVRKEATNRMSKVS